MKAARYHEAGKFVCEEIPDVKPGKGEVRIAVSWCGICGSDLHIYLGHMDKRVHAPLQVGHEMSGVIAEVGEGVSGWSAGDKVTVRPLDNCGDCPTCRAGFGHICENLKFMGIDTPGAFAAYWTVPAKLLHRLPDRLPLTLGALVEPLAVACHDVRRGEAVAGDVVMVNGGGPIGILVAMVARRAGAKVLLSEINPHRLAFAAKQGFAVVDPLRQSVPEALEQLGAKGGADVFFEVSGSKPGALAMTTCTRPRGRIVMVAIYPEPVPVDLHRFFWKELQLRGARVYEPEDFDAAIKLAASGELPLESLITAKYPLSQTQQAFEFLAASANGMKILIGGE